MKIFWQENNLWNKAKNILKLYKLKYDIPKTFVIEKNEINSFNFNLLENNKKYILRPSFELEDWKNKSFAGFFESIICKNIKEIKNIFNYKNIEENFSWKWYNLKSIIIQEFIETNIYWVYFTRSPENIFLKWYYEIWENNNSVTNWKYINNKLNFFQEKELELTWKKLEKYFNYPQDIEFCIKNNKIIILQTRNITTWNNTIYNFSEIQKINWIYKYLDFDELWNKQDYFSYEILSKLFNIILLWEKIYFKQSIIPYYLFKNTKSKNNNLNLFYKIYKKYLLKKIIYNLLKLILPQKLDKKVLLEFFKNYNYSFLINKKSNLELNFSYKTNFITKKFLKLEKLKNKAFFYLKKYKKEYKNNNFKLKNINIKQEKLIFYKWIILNYKKEKNKNFKWIYKWKLSGILTNFKNFQYKKNLNQILFIENLDLNLYDKLDYIDWLIVKNWNLLSHNSIILREYKIPSIIQYKYFDNLKNWEKIIL